MTKPLILRIETAAQRIIDAALAEAAGRYNRLLYWHNVAEWIVRDAPGYISPAYRAVCELVGDALEQALFAHPDSPFRLNADTTDNDFVDWPGGVQ